MAARRRRDEEDLSEGEDDLPKLRQEATDDEEEVGKPGLVSGTESEDEEDYKSAPEVSDDRETPGAKKGEQLEEKQAVENKNEETEETPLTATAPANEEEKKEEISESKKEDKSEEKKEETPQKVEDERDQDDIEGVASRLQDVNMEDDNPPQTHAEEDNMSAASNKENEDDEAKEDRSNEDEDEKHPAFIPRKGLFFLHDDRIDQEYENAPSGPKMDIEMAKEASPLESEPELEEEEGEKENWAEKEEEDPLKAQEREREERARKKAERRANLGDKWSHDKFEEQQQQPRSLDELVERYGFDIRSLPADADFSKLESDENSPGKRTRPQRRNPSGPKRGGMRNQNPRNQQREPRNNKNRDPPQLKNNEDFPDLKGANSQKPKEQKPKRDGNKREHKPRNNRDNQPRENRDNRDVNERNESTNGRVKGKRQTNSPRMVVTIENGFDGQNQRQEAKPRNNRREQRERGNSDIGKNKNERQRKDVQKQRDDKPPNNRQRKNREPMPKRDNDDRQQQPRRRDSKQDQRRRVDQFGRDQRDSDEQFDTRRRRSSPPRKRVEDPAPPIRTRRYSSDLSDEDFSHSRPPPPRRRKNQKDGLQPNDMGNNKVPLQVELANVRDILEKQGMYETQRKDDRKPDRRRRDMDSRKDSRDDKGPKRYSNRTRPKHWNERPEGSQSPPQPEIAQSFDGQFPQTDEFRDVLGKHFNVSSQRAKELIMQIKTQLTPAMPQGTDIFQQGTQATNFPERVQAVDNRRNNMTNEQMLAYQQQYQQLLHQNQQQLASGIGQDAMQDMVRNLQQEQYNRQLNIAGNFYQQQGSIPNYDASLTQQIQANTTGFSGINVPTVNSAMANPVVSTNALNSLMQHNGTTYFQPVDKRQNY